MENEINGEVYVGSVEVHCDKENSQEGWISITKSELFKYRKHNIRYKLIVLEDLGPCECSSCKPKK